MKMYFTKESISDLTPAIIPDIDADGRRKGKKTKPNPTGKPYVIYDLDRASPTSFGLYVGRKKCTFVLQVRVGSRVRKVSVGELGSLTLSSVNFNADARTSATDLRAKLKAGANLAQARSVERTIRDSTLENIFAEYLIAYSNGASPKMNTISSIKAAIKRLDKLKLLRTSVRAIGSDFVDEIWDKICNKEGHHTAAEQTLMWCRAAFNVYLKKIGADANKFDSPVVPLINPFKWSTQYVRKRKDLEKEYEEKRVRNPIGNCPEQFGRFLDMVWTKRDENRGAADYILTTLLLGVRRCETSPLM